nr:single-stranded-DNA-specific exonuclease RecJ [Victivallales bacterium]
VLRENGANVSCFLPHRFDDGYGMTAETLGKALAESSCSLIITVDCGISAHDAVNLAAEKRIDVIISDHHEPSETLPRALSIVNPKLHPSLKNLHILAGVGVAFKLAHGFIKMGRKKSFCGNEYDLRKDFDLVALGTVADLVPLIGENRIMVSRGLKRLSEQIRPGINALCEASKIFDEVRSSDITYSLSPRLNAAGRLENAIIAFKMLVERDRISAVRFAEEINQLNIRRQEKEGEISRQVQAEIEKIKDVDSAASIVVHGEDWNLGVIGIVASKISKEFSRPTIIFSVKGDIAHGSARSVDNMNILELLSESSSMLERYGGHAMAAGLAIKTSKLCEFREHFEESVKKRSTDYSRKPKINIDGIVDLSDMNEEFFKEIPRLEPFGYGNNSPSYRINRLKIKQVMPAANIHSRGILFDEKNRELPFIAFHCGTDELQGIEMFDVAATPQLNNFRGKISPQLQIHDFKPSC